jgi:hypothetical protein
MFTDDGHTRHFSSPSCSEQFTCVVAVIPYRSINLAFSLSRRCYGWSVTAVPVTSVLPLLKLLTHHLR